MSEIKVGDKAILNVGSNKITVQVMRPMGNGKAFWVKNLASGKEFIMPGARLHIPTVSVEPIPATEPPAAERSPQTSIESPVTENTPHPKQEKKLSLLEAAVEALKATGKAMNTREMVKTATEMGVWVPSACKTPEQTLYGSIFREIKTKEQPRIVKAEEKGKFRLA